MAVLNVNARDSRLELFRLVLMAGIVFYHFLVNAVSKYVVTRQSKRPPPPMAVGVYLVKSHYAVLF